MTLIELTLIALWVLVVILYPERSKKTGERNAKWAVVLGAALVVATGILAF